MVPDRISFPPHERLPGRIPGGGLFLGQTIHFIQEIILIWRQNAAQLLPLKLALMKSHQRGAPSPSTRPCQPQEAAVLSGEAVLGSKRQHLSQLSPGYLSGGDSCGTCLGEGPWRKRAGGGDDGG